MRKIGRIGILLFAFIALIEVLLLPEKVSLIVYDCFLATWFTMFEIKDQIIDRL